MAQQIAKKKYNRFDRKLISEETYRLLLSMLESNPEKRISWQKLFAYEEMRAQKGQDHDNKFRVYEEFLNKISSKRAVSIPGIFCILQANKNLNHNEPNKKPKHQPQSNQPTAVRNQKTSSKGLKFLDLKLSTQLFLNLMSAVQMTGQQQTTINKKESTK